MTDTASLDPTLIPTLSYPAATVNMGGPPSRDGQSYREEHSDYIVLLPRVLRLRPALPLARVGTLRANMAQSTTE